MIQEFKFLNKTEMTDTRHSDAELDASGLYCPLPVLRAKKTLDKMSDNSVLKLIATDPGSQKDIEAYTQQSGHKLLDTEHTDEQFVFYIKKTVN